MNLVPARSGATMIDDCYNANPSSMEAALRTLAFLPRGSRIAVLGDMLELGEQAETTHQEIGALAAQTVDRLVVLGDFAPVVVSAARRAGLSSDRAVEVGSAEEAVRVVIPYLNPQARVLVKGSRGMHLEKVVEGLRAR
jgi:UDP-N-acetylmuramoyl-tripeptide--D-alanyl-D-alanine ligase